MERRSVNSFMYPSRAGGGLEATILSPAYYEGASFKTISAANDITSAFEPISLGDNSGYISQQQTIESEAGLMAISREELDAKLAQNKAEVTAVAAEMRREMSEWRTQQSEMMMKLQSEVSSINVKLDERFEAQKRSSSLIQWLVGIILAFVALVPAFQGMFDKNSSAEKNTPIIIQVPQPTAQQSFQVK